MSLRSFLFAIGKHTWKQLGVAIWLIRSEYHMLTPQTCWHIAEPKLKFEYAVPSKKTTNIPLPEKQHTYHLERS